MSAQPTEPGMTKTELVDLIKATAAEAVAPSVAAALEPLAKSQGNIAELLAKMSEQKDSAGTQTFNDAELGKYPIGRKARALALCGLEKLNQNDPDAIAFAVKKHWAPTVVAPTLKWISHVKTTLTAGTAATAGDMVFPQYDTEWIELLRNNAVVRSICRVLPMPRGATSRRKQTGAGTAYYQGETDRITASNQTVGRINLSYKKLTAMTVVSNDLVRFSGGEADRLVQTDLLAQSGLREDQALLVGNPPVDAGSPQGIRYQTNASNIYASAGTSLANFQSDLTKAIRLVEEANIPVTTSTGYWMMSPRTYWVIYALTTTTGDWVFAQELAAGRLFGYPILKTTQLSVSNSFIGANAGMIFFVHAPAMEIHDSMQRTVATYVGGAYYDAATAAVVSGISSDETVITCISEHDFAQIYDKAASIITGYAT